MSLAIYSLVFGVFFKVQAPIGANGELQNFAMYLFCGLVVWNGFSAALDGPLGAFSDAGKLLTKVYFPPELPVGIGGGGGVSVRHRAGHPGGPHGALR